MIIGSEQRIDMAMLKAVGFGLAAVLLVAGVAPALGQTEAAPVTLPSPAKPADASPLPVDDALVAGAGDALLERWTGDLEGLEERRRIRFLVTYNRTNFFIEDGLEHGFEHELIVQFVAFLNQDLGQGEQPISLVTLPMPFAQLIPRLRAGEGDVIAAGLTITPERAALVDFTLPYLPDVKEILIAAEGVSGIATLDDLAGRTVHVSGGRSYADHLRALSERLESEGRPPIEVVEVDQHLETEDLLQLVNAGLFELTVADDHIAEIWSGSLPNIVLHEDLAINRGGRIAWAIRQGSPALLARLDAFMKDHQRGTLLGNILFERYFEDDTWISNPLAPEHQLDLARYADLFQTYGAQYDLDWRLVAALSFQESKLKQDTVSDAGAIGLMQVRPETAAEPAIGLPDVRDTATNVHAGVKYLDFLRDEYFDDPAIEPAAQIDFSLAAYNAGPERVLEMRERAKELGLDPNVWFRNVELVAFDEFSRETVRHVTRVNKYYIAYKLSDERLQARSEAVDDIAAPE